MNRISPSWSKMIVWVYLAVFLLGCSPAIQEPTIAVPTMMATVATTLESGEAFTGQDLPPESPLPTEIDTSEDMAGSSNDGKKEAVQELAEPSLDGGGGGQAPTYRANDFLEDDMLNVRSGPGVSYAIVGELPLSAVGIRVTGTGQDVGSSTWLPVKHPDASGWVNSRFLVEELNIDEFCDARDALRLVEELRTVTEEKDGNKLSHMVAEGRDLRIRRHWWNPEVRLGLDMIPEIFVSDEIYDWGVADGTGRAMVGSFKAEIDPLIEKDLVDATEIACGEILHGGTAGTVRIPREYEGINFYSLYRPAGPDEYELDWGTWVIGIERWQGEFGLSYLIHYDWEI